MRVEMGYNLATAEGQQARLDEINAKAKPGPIYQFGHAYLYAVLRGEAEYDPRMIRVAMKLIDFELAKKAVTAHVHGIGDLRERLEKAEKARLKLIAEERPIRQFVRRF